VSRSDACARATGDVGAPGQRAGLCADDGAAGGFADHTAGEVVVTFQERKGADAAVFLSDHAVDDDVTRGATNGFLDVGRRVQGGDDTAFHVGSTAAVDASVGDVRNERWCGPRLLAGRYDVDVAVQAEPWRALALASGGRGDGDQPFAVDFLAGVARAAADRLEVFLGRLHFESEASGDLGDRRLRCDLVRAGGDEQTDVRDESGDVDRGGQVGTKPVEVHGPDLLDRQRRVRPAAPAP
jgi:hypothetical protein